MTADLTAAREALRDEMDEWEVFVAGDGERSIRMKDHLRDPQEIMDRIAPLIAAAVRAQVAAEIAELLTGTMPNDDYSRGYVAGVHESHILARGGGQ